MSPGLLQLTVLRHRGRSVQNAAARLMSGSRRYDHITPVLQPTGAALASGSTSGGFQEATLVSTCHSPSWLQPIWPPSVGLRLKSSSAAFCHIKDVHCEANLQQLWTIVAAYGDRCFAAAGPKLWNSLPADLRQADTSFQKFKQRHFCSGAEIATHCN